MTRIPGTFKERPALRRDLSPEGDEAEQVLLGIGALTAERWLIGSCTVMLAREPSPAGGYRWHLSIAHPNRYPTWDEVKTAAWGCVQLPAGRTFAQRLGHPVAEGEYVNVHENCFHLYEIDDPFMGPEGV